VAFSVSWTYQIIDKYSRTMKRIQKSTERARKSMVRAQAAVSKFGQKATAAQSTLASFGGAIGGGVMLSKFNSFETSMNKLGAVSLANDEVMNRFRETAKQLGITTQFSAGQAAEGMVFLSMAGLDAEKTLKAIPGTLQLAAAGGLDLASAADIATNVLAQMGLQVEDLTRVNDVLSKVQSLANTDVLQAAEAMKNLGATASSLGITIEQTASLIGNMASAGVKGGEAGTLLRNAIIKLANSTPKAQKTFRQLGIDMKNFVTPEGKVKNFSKLIGLLGEKGATTAQIFNIFEERGGRAILSLQKMGTPAIDKMTAALEKSGGTAEKMAKIQMKGLPGIMKLVASAAEGLNIALFESGLADLLGAMFTKIANIARAVSKSNPVLLKMAGIAGLLLAALGPVLIMVGFMATGVSALMGVFTALMGVVSVGIAPIVAIAAGVGVLIAAIVKAVSTNKELQASFGGLWEAIKALTTPLRFVWNLMGGLDGIGKGLAVTFNVLAEVIGAVLTLAVKTVTFAINAALAPLRAIKAAAEIFTGANQSASARAVAAANQGNINGRIEVAGVGGATVKSAEMTTDLPGNLGFNMGGA
jgi:TP901 family phage tail tape measure protein